MFLMVITALAGILSGTAIQATAVDKTSSGNAWTALVVGATLAIMTCAMSTHAVAAH